MPKVVLSSGSSMQALTGGQTEFEVEATTFRRLVLELEQRFQAWASRWMISLSGCRTAP